MMMQNTFHLVEDKLPEDFYAVMLKSATGFDEWWACRMECIQYRLHDIHEALRQQKPQA